MTETQTGALRNPRIGRTKVSSETPVCVRNLALFDSVEQGQGSEAREACSHCHILDACRTDRDTHMASRNSFYTGTWAGETYLGGKRLATGNDRVCRGCQRPMRTRSKVRPGDVRHHAHGLCKNCYRRISRRLRKPA